jgi:adenylate kinase
MLQEHGIALDAVVELQVDEDALVRRIENRIAETKARGEPLRDDDSPEVLRKRLGAYRQQTAPLIAYYRQKGMLRSVNGMAAIADVTTSIDQALPSAPPRQRAAAAEGKKKKPKHWAKAAAG